MRKKLSFEQSQKFSSCVREFYLYPELSKRENVMRGTIWILSWIIGIVAPVISHVQMDGAYFIFSCSLLSEFLTIHKKNKFANIVHGVFCCVLLSILLVSIFITFCGVHLAKKEKYIRVYNLINNLLFIVSIIVIAYIILSVFLSMFDADDSISKNGQNMDINNQEHEIHDLFMKKLNGSNSEGE